MNNVAEEVGKKGKKPKKEKKPKVKKEKRPKGEKKVKEKKEGGGKKKLIIIIAVVLVLLIAIGAFVLIKMRGSKGEDADVLPDGQTPGTTEPSATVQKPFNSMELLLQFGFVGEGNLKSVKYYDPVLTKEAEATVIPDPNVEPENDPKEEDKAEEVPAEGDAEPAEDEAETEAEAEPMGTPVTVVNSYSNRDFSIEYNNAYELPWLRIGKGQYFKKFGSEYVAQINFVNQNGKDINVFYMVADRFTGLLSVKEWNKDSPHGKELYNPYKGVDELSNAEKMECADYARMFIYSLINWSGETLGVSPMALGYLYHSNVVVPKYLNDLTEIKFELEENEFFGEKANVYVRKGYIKDKPDSHVALLFKENKGCKVQMQVDGLINEYLITPEGAVTVTKGEMPTTAKQAYLMVKMSELTNISPYTMANLKKFTK